MYLQLIVQLRCTALNGEPVSQKQGIRLWHVSWIFWDFLLLLSLFFFLPYLTLPYLVSQRLPLLSYSLYSEQAWNVKRITFCTAGRNYHTANVENRKSFYEVDILCVRSRLCWRSLIEKGENITALFKVAIIRWQCENDVTMWKGSSHSWTYREISLESAAPLSFIELYRRF